MIPLNIPLNDVLCKIYKPHLKHYYCWFNLHISDLQHIQDRQCLAFTEHNWQDDSLQGIAYHWLTYWRVQMLCLPAQPVTTGNF